MAITDSIMKIANEKGYTGQNPQKISEAVNALGSVMGGGGSGGSAIMFVDFTNSEQQQTGYNFTSSKTAEEVYNHIIGGGLAYIRVHSPYPSSSLDDDYRCMPVTNVTKESNPARFSAFADSKSDAGNMRASIDDYNNVTTGHVEMS